MGSAVRTSGVLCLGKVEGFGAYKGELYSNCLDGFRRGLGWRVMVCFREWPSLREVTRRRSAASERSVEVFAVAIVPW